MMYDFDTVVDRRHTNSLKWRRYGEALPLWVADMDFRAPEPVLAALREQLEHGILGYPCEPPELRRVLVTWLERRFRWRVSPEALVFVPGVVTAFNVACRATCRPAQGVLVQTPVYRPILDAAANHGLRRDEMTLTRTSCGRYEVDVGAMDSAIGEHTRLFLLCNPHNPTGRAFTQAELSNMADLCLQHNLVICSDEIHGDLVLPGSRHIPIATLGPEVAARTITLLAPSKTFNIPGLGFSVAIIEDAQLRKAFNAAQKDLVPHPNLLGYVAALAAYAEGEQWLNACLDYLMGNCNYLMSCLAGMPGIEMSRPEATYLAWLDCRKAGLGDVPAEFFLKLSGVALSEGANFGRGGQGFVRLNFACPRSVLAEALDRMSLALGTVLAPRPL